MPSSLQARSTAFALTSHPVPPATPALGARYGFGLAMLLVFCSIVSFMRRLRPLLRRARSHSRTRLTKAMQRCGNCPCHGSSCILLLDAFGRAGSSYARRADCRVQRSCARHRACMETHEGPDTARMLLSENVMPPREMTSHHRSTAHALLSTARAVG